MNNKKVIEILLPLLLLLTGLYLVPHRLFEMDFSKIPGDLGDARFNNYILEHGHLFLTGKTGSFWDAPFMYPFSNVISLSDNLLGTMPVYSLFRSIGVNRETAFQLWLITLFILNFICCYWALQKWSGNPFLSATGAYIFTFSIFILGHIYNVQVFPRFMVPLIFYWTWKYLSFRQVKYFLFICIGTVYQFYCGIYLGFLLVYVLMFLFLTYIIIYRDKQLFRQFKDQKKIFLHAGIIVLALAFLAPLMLPYLEISHNMGMRTFEEAISSIPTLRSYFFTSKAPILWQSLSNHGIDVLPDWWCHFLFMGAIPWIGILSVPFFMCSKKVELRKKKLLLFLCLTLFLCFIFCLNINGFSLYRIIFMLPGFSSMRSINRIINTEIVLFILIFVYSFNELRKHYRFFKWCVIVFPLLIIVDNLFDPFEVKRFDKYDSQQQVKQVKDNIAGKYNSAFAAVAYLASDYSGNEIRTNLNVMLAAQELGIPCVNAYTGSYPDAFMSFLSHPDNKGLKQWCENNHTNIDKIQTINDLGVTEKGRQSIQLKAANGMFVCSDGAIGNIIIANKEKASSWETFTMIETESDRYVLLDYNNHFLSSEIDKEANITATRTRAGSWEIFTLIPIDDRHVAFKALNERFFSLDPKTLQLFATSNTIGTNETFELIVN
jgi:hypothetical protein